MGRVWDRLVGQAQGVDWVLCPPLCWCCMQRSCTGPYFCFQHLRSGSWVLAFLYLVVHHLPPLCMHAVTFSPLDLLCRASLVAQMIRNLPATGRPQFDPWVRKIPWRRESSLYSVLKETFVQVQALQCRAPGPSLSQRGTQAPQV